MKKRTFRPIVEPLEDLVLPASRFSLGGALTELFHELRSRWELRSTQDQSPRLSGIERRQQVWNQRSKDESGGGGISILSGQAPVVGTSSTGPKFLTQTSSVTVGFTDADWPGDPSSPYVVAIQWGDGQTYQENVPHPVPVTANHVYAATGVYTVTATITDPTGNMGSASIGLIVTTVSSVEWIALDSPLDGNPNPGGGLRIFPDKPTPSGP